MSARPFQVVPKKHHLAHPKDLDLRGNLVLEESLRKWDMVRVECLAPGLNMFSATFFVKEGPAVGANAPLLGVSLKKYTGLLGTPCFTLIIQSDSSLRRTDGGAA